MFKHGNNCVVVSLEFGLHLRLLASVRKVGSSVARTSATGTVRARPNAGSSITKGSDNWVGSSGGVAHD